MPPDSCCRVFGNGDNKKESNDYHHEDADYKSPASAVSGAIFVAHLLMPPLNLRQSRHPGNISKQRAPGNVKGCAPPAKTPNLDVSCADQTQAQLFILWKRIWKLADQFLAFPPMPRRSCAMNGSLTHNRKGKTFSVASETDGTMGLWRDRNSCGNRRRFC